MTSATDHSATDHNATDHSATDHSTTDHNTTGQEPSTHEVDTGSTEATDDLGDHSVDVSIDAPRSLPPSGITERIETWMRWVRDERRRGIVIGVVVVTAWAVLAGWWMPRGPLTTGAALWSIVFSTAVGVAAGATMRSRWAMLVAPAGFAVVFEAVRVGTDGPLVDGFHASQYGLIAFVVGRGFHALVSLLPMSWAAALGAGLARRTDRADESGIGTRRGRVGVVVRRTVAVIAGVGLIVFSLALARPASTDAITGPDGGPLPGSVAELTTVDVNGHELAMMIRGHSVDNPVLLFLAGGPGGSEIGAMRRHLSALEEHFTVVTWDQRGTGKSYPELDPTDTITLDGFVADTIVVTDYLRDRFGQDQIYLLGQSWGTILGVLAVQEHAESYRAFIGTGQMVSPLETDRMFYDDAVDWARANGHGGLLADLLAIGPPPYEEMLDYETALANEQEVYRYDHSQNSEGEGQMSENLLVEEYILIEQVHVLAGFMDTFSVLYPQLQDIDFRSTATDFPIPMFFVQGAHEAPGRAEPFEEWYAMVDAPQKDVTVLDTSGHRPLFEQPDEFVAYMVDTVLADTVPADVTDD